MANRVIASIKGVDQFISRSHLALFKEKNSLMTFLFHGLFNDKNEIALKHGDPQQQITTAIFRQFIEYYLRYGYQFVSPQDILDGLEPDGKYVLITFDDGYYNNHLASPILKEYEIPAVFFISSNHVAESKSFWWDAVYRERSKRGASSAAMNEEFRMLKEKKNADIEQYVIEKFGLEALRPISDIDRPFTPSELKEFSKEEFVFMGNHSSNHDILTNYSLSEVKSAVVKAQKSISYFTGIEPIIISYPNGKYSSDVVSIMPECGLKLAITIRPYKNYLPLNLKGNNAFLLNRFTLLGYENIVAQCKVFRSDIRLLEKLKKYVRGVSL